MSRKSKHITNTKDIEELVNLKETDITKTLQMNYFGDFGDGPRFNPYDTIDIPPGKYVSNGKPNKNTFTTTVGLWIFNKYFIEKQLTPLFGYVNNIVDGGVLKKMNEDISHGLIEETIPLIAMKEYLMKQQQTMRLVSILSPSYTMKMLKTSEHIAKEKEKLIKNNKEALDSGDEVVAGKIEKQLMDSARTYLKDDPSMDMYNSKARGSFDNNFKNMYIMKGAVFNPITNKFEIATSNYVDGIKKDEYEIFANALVGAGYAKSNNTALGGYWAKLYTNALQHIVAGPAGSDCKTKRHITVKLDDSNIDGYMYSFIIQGDKLIELTNSNKSKFIGKTVKIRFSSMCESKDYICNACLGMLFYRMGIQKVGMTSLAVPNKIMVLSMKKFHNQQVKLIEMDPGKAFGF